MSGCHSKLSDKSFINWIKASLASNIVKDGLEELVEIGINEFHKSALNSVATKEQKEKKDLCSVCTIENVLPCRTSNFCFVKQGKCFSHDSKQKSFQLCPRNMCGRLKEIIREHHNFNCPSWKNTHAEKWCNTPWEVGKCYLPPDGYLHKTSIREIDLNGILNILLNHSDFKTVVDANLCKEVRSAVNNLRHSPNLCVEDGALQNYLDKFVSFLECSYTLKNDLKAKEAAKSILKLQKGELSLSDGDITKLLEKCIEEKTQGSVQDISEKTDQELLKLRAAVEELKSKSISDIISAKEKAILDINTVGADKISSVEKSVEKLECAKRDIELAARKETSQTEQNYERLKNIFREDLVSFNDYWHSTIQITPLFEEEDAPINEFYVRPDLVAIQGQISDPQKPEIRVALNSLEELFYKADKRYNEIYLMADAGLGKTSFTKYLVAMWCHAVQPCESPTRSFADNDVTAMKRFDVVILLQLRDMCDDCDVDDMIFNQIVNQFSRSAYFTKQFLQEILHKETCLIILDGLDEWSHPFSSCRKMPKSIPHRKVRPVCTVLTTTRPWKLGTVEMKSSHIDKRVELSGLSEQNISRLKFLAISNMKGINEDTQRSIENFNAEIKIKELGNLESNPMLLLYLICVWNEGKALGDTKTDIFCQIIELLISRAELKAEWQEIERNTNFTAGALDRGKIPACFGEQDLCIKYYGLLQHLGHLSFETLFNENRKHSLIFDDATTDGYLTKHEKRLSLLSGILTESKVRVGLTRKRYIVSFCHKSVQEYLAALYMQGAFDQARIVEKTFKICNSVEQILEMSNQLVFLSGLNYQCFIRIAGKIADIINNDEITRKYRHCCISSTSNYNNIVKPLKDIQNMYINCVKEVKGEKQVPFKFCLQDLFIDDDCLQDIYKDNLQILKRANNGFVKSLDIRITGTPHLKELIDVFELRTETHLERINFRGDCCTEDIESLLYGSSDNLKCVEILSSAWTGKKFMLKYANWLDALSSTFNTMKNLEALHLYAFSMTHDQLSKMMTLIVQRKSLRDIALLNLKCSDHNSACSGCTLDLSQHDRLRLLSLDNLPISDLSINVSSLQDCVVGRLPNSGVLSSFLSSLKSTTQLHSFTCRNLKSAHQVDAMLETLNELVSLRYVGLLYIDLDERNQLLDYELSTLDVVRLVEVTMKCCVVRSLVEVIKKLRQQVTVVLLKCEVKPEDEFEIVKKDMKKDEKVLVIFDGVCKAHIKQFIFKSYGAT